MRHLVPLLLAALITAGPAAPQARDSVVGEVRMIGELWVGGKRKDIAGRAMVCGLRGPSSFLSIRASGSTDAAELLRLPYLGIVELTGQADAAQEWVEVSGYRVELSPDGRTMAADQQTIADLNGWVHSRYLCNFLY